MCAKTRAAKVYGMNSFNGALSANKMLQSRIRALHFSVGECGRGRGVGHRGGRGGEQHLRNGARICCQLSGHRNDGIAGCAFECPWLTNFPPPLVALSIFYIFADIRRPFCGFIIIYSYASGCRNGKIVNRRIYSNDWVQNLKQSNISDLPAKLLN